MKSADVPSSIVRLPLEVLEVFIQYSPVSSQLATSRVSKLFHSLTIRPLYRDISLCSPRVVVACCRTLISNNTAAKTVRSFSINYTHYSSSSNSLLSAYYSRIKKALLALSGLYTLKLLVHDPYFVNLLNHCMFPTLRQFECYLTPSTLLIEFLNRHPRINYLQVSPHENTSELSEDDNKLPALELPRLQYFAGNVQSLQFLGTACTLRAAIISWNAMDTNPDLAFSALQRSSRDTISIRLPDVLSLHISNVLLVDANPTETYLQAIRAFLPRFTQLQRLKINCIDYWEMGDISCQIDQDFSTVTEWGDACPSLIEITLPRKLVSLLNDLSWYRVSESVWIPDPKHTAGGAVIVEGLDGRLERTTPTPIEFIETIANVRSQLGGMLRPNTGDLSIRHEGDPGDERNEPSA
ncbi:hypothetical protein BDZ97DRAFT_1815441 [Flammula alnicola]|nr:hypothetical protein BDZ97DRAFT_1815441 [Flammula alnicola]